MLLLPLFLASLVAAAPPSDSLRRSTVQIHIVTREPDWSQPWQFQRQHEASGSGVVIAGRRILTNAHVVANATYLTVRRSGDVKNYTARVAFVAHDGELALVTVDDPTFFDATPAVEFGDLPSPRDKLLVYGFPTGGSELSITEGTVSRLGVVDYVHSGRKLLAIQTDAAINPGNSGGPVFQNGRLVGIAFQHMSGSQSIGYAVPIPLVRRFLDDVKDGKYEGIPALGVRWQETENPALRAAYGLTAAAEGVLVSKVQFGSSAWGVLRSGDVIVRVGGVPVAENGTVKLRGDERVDFGDLISRRRIGESLPIEIVREGKPVSVSVRLKPLIELVPGPQHDVLPSYFILGGFVLTPLTEDFFRAHGGGTHHLRGLSEEVATPDHTQIVVLAQVLAHEANRGYHGWALDALTKVNGRSIGRLQDAVEASRFPLDGRQVLEFDDGSRAVLDAAAAAKATTEIMAGYGVPRDRSADMETNK